MLNIQERIAQYSDKDLAAMRSRLETQRDNYWEQVHEDKGSHQFITRLLLEIIAADQSVMEALRRANPVDINSYYRTSNALDGIRKLDVLANRMRLEAERRMKVVV